jgi:DNA polymerase II large subunit
MQRYFDELKQRSAACRELACKARAKGLDPAPDVEITLAENMAQRVEGLISVLAPQIVGKGMVERIIELEKQYGALDWRVALKIAEEIAAQKFCVFKDELEAMNIGIRAGFAYVTVGVVSSPLDGIVTIEKKKRMDGGDYLAVSFAGPIRNAGGTAAAVSVIIADYVRMRRGVGTYDATDQEMKRAVAELQDYHERVTNLQYYPYEEELHFLMKHLPVEVAGEPSEQIDVSNYKDLPRIPTNKIRSGFCLIMSSCIPLKAPKLWKQLGKWGKDFDMGHWNFLEEMLKIQKKMKAGGAGKAESGSKKTVQPDYTYIADLVAGRPVLGHPLRKGGWRLRYGRSRASGLSGQSIHPATMHILNNYIATGTQLKVERPGKGAAFTPCDTIEGPIVKLHDGSVLRLETELEAKAVRNNILEILFLGDVLVPYGDFVNRAHMLVPVGYCEEWWQKEVEKAIVTTLGSLDHEKAAEFIGLTPERLATLLNEPLRRKPTIQEAAKISVAVKAPLHPAFTYHWNDIDLAALTGMLQWLASGTWTATDAMVSKIVVAKDEAHKRTLELCGVPHKFVNNEFVVIEGPVAAAVSLSVGAAEPAGLREKLASAQAASDQAVAGGQPVDALTFMNGIASVSLRDKSGTYIGSRMGRPEKAKMRKMTGDPHGLCPIGDEGGRLRSVNAAVEVGYATVDAPVRWCSHCELDCIYPVCDNCGWPTDQRTVVKPQRTGDNRPPENSTSSRRQIPIRRIFENTLRTLAMDTYPELIKGVRGMMSDTKAPEHVGKAILRARNSVFVNKDGTVRYDCSELALTHFRPREIGTNVERLHELGYTHDIKGRPLENVDQVLELKPQDVVIPCCLEALPHEPSDQVFFRVSRFVDEELERLYSLPAYYNLKSPQDLVGQLIIGLAPHTSAGMIGRIIGFSRTQGFFAHPYYHSACRRDCDGDEIGFLLLMDALLNFSRQFLPSSRGGTMDAPLVLTTVLTPSEVDDMAFDVDIAWHYPLELYTAALEMKMPWDVKIRQIKDVLGTPEQYEGMGFTHDTSDVNCGVTCSAYKKLPSMEEKLKGQMDLAFKIRAVDTDDVARLVIEKHFIKDTKGNLRKFSMQEFRCVSCNEKFRRPPLAGKCTACGGKLVFTIAEGSVIKYLEPTVSLARAYNLSPYLRQSVELLQRQVESVFGKDKEKQVGLGAWFG